MKNYTIISGFVLSAVLLWLALRGVNSNEIAAAFRDADLIMIAPILLCLAGFYALKAARWSDLLLPTQKLRLQDLIPSMMAGAAGNNLLPAHLGEFVRVYLLGREFQLRKSTVLATLVLERLLDIFAVLVLLLVATLLGTTNRYLEIAAIFLAVGATAAIAAACFVAFKVDRSIAIAEFLLRPLPQRIREKVAQQVAFVSEGFGALKAPRMYLRISVNSLLQWLSLVGCIYFSLVAFGIGVPIYVSVLIMALIVAGLTLPTSPGFVGTIQFCFVLGLKPYGIDQSVAFSASLFYHAILWSTVTLSGLYYLRHFNTTFAKLRVLRDRDA